MFARLRFVPLLLVLATGCKDRGAKRGPAPKLDAGAAAKRPVGEVAGDAEGVWIYAPVARSREEPPPRFAAELPAGVEAMKRFRERDPWMPPRVHVEDQLCGLDEAMLARLDAAIAATPEAERAAMIASWSDLIEYCGTGVDGSRFCPGTRPIVTGPLRASRSVLLLPFAKSCSTADDVELFTRADTPAAAVIAYYWEGGGRGTPPTPRLYAAVREHLAEEPRISVLALAATGEKKAVAEAIKLCTETGQSDCAALGARDPHHRKEKPAAGGTRADATKLADQLRAIGLLGAEPFPLPENTIRAHTAADVLEHGGRALAFDAETGSFPNDHDHPARKLARLCRPALDGALFAEEPPPDPESPGGYRIQAWVAGEKLETGAENLGDWYDVDAVVGLVNEALRVVGSDCRLLVLPAEGQVAVVAAGPAAALIAAIRAGLFPTGE